MLVHKDVHYSNMSKLLVFRDYIVFYNHQIIVYKTGSEETIKNVYVNELLMVRQSDNSGTLIDTLQISPCGKYVVVAVGKEVILLSFPLCEKLKGISVEKTATSVQFFYGEKLFLIADRSGIVTFINYENELKKRKEILGHNSMLTAACISFDDKFVITSDRDEKIRVSHFPQVFNICSFCLGHNMFVSSICMLPIDPRILVSASGDGTIRIWDFVNGKELSKCDIAESCGQRALVKVNCTINNNECLLAVQKYKSSEISILSVSGTLESGIDIKLNTQFLAKGIVLDVSFQNLDLLILTDNKNEPLQIWPDETCLNLKNLMPYIKEAMSVNSFDSFQLLFKRDFDNVQDYHEKKKARLIGQLVK